MSNKYRYCKLEPTAESVAIRTIMASYFLDMQKSIELLEEKLDRVISILEHLPPVHGTEYVKAKKDFDIQQEKKEE